MKLDFEKEGYLGTTAAPINIIYDAKSIARIRTNINKKALGNAYYNPYYYREGISDRVEYLGILAELIARDYLKNNNIQFVGTKLVNDKPLQEPDIIFNGKNIDVKGLWSMTNELMVNEKAHNKNKGISHYWFLQIEALHTIKVNHFFYRYELISEWNVKKCAFTNAYCSEIIDKEDLQVWY